MNTKMKMIGLLIISILFLGACTSNNPLEMTKAPQEESTTPLEDPVALAEEAEDELALEEKEETEPTSEDSSTDSATASSQTNQETSNIDNELTQAEIDSLVFMREEEKLARDVYLGLYDLWGLSIFQNIANSEQTHTDAVKGLLDQFDIEDPADTSPPGIFVDEALQKLYDDLMVLGAQSLGDALKVGAAIEEIDILDLQEALEYTQNESIQRVYENLLKGSENHLRAFTSTLDSQTGEPYQPQYLSASVYDEILAASAPRGGRGNNNRP